MNNEQLEKGKQLSQQIEKKRHQLSRWESSIGVYELKLKVPETSQSSNDRGWVVEEVSADSANFEVLKTLAVSKVKAELKLLETEYGDL